MFELNKLKYLLKTKDRETEKSQYGHFITLHIIC